MSATTSPPHTAQPVRQRKLRPGRIITIALSALLILLVGATGIFLLLPSRIDAVAWTPPVGPALSGPLAANTALQDATLISQDQIQGPEDIVIDEQNYLYTGSQDGRIYRIDLDDPQQSTTVFADTEGRPLGLAFDQQGNLIVADSERGLLAVDQNGTVTLLTDRVDDTPIDFADELVIASNGIIYFSDASTRFPGASTYDLLEGRPHGRILTYDPATQQTSVLLTDLYFANGVALSPEEDQLLIVESFRYRVTRYWLEGPRQGTHETLSDNLPGIPDNISRAPDGTYWLALGGVRSGLIDWLHQYPFLKNQLGKLDSSFLRSVGSGNYGLAVQIDGQGQIIQSLHDPDGAQLAGLSTVVQHGNDLYLGVLLGSRIGRYTLS